MLKKCFVAQICILYRSSDVVLCGMIPYCYIFSRWLLNITDEGRDFNAVIAHGYFYWWQFKYLNINSIYNAI